MGSTLAAFTSAFPAVALLFGFLLVLVGTTDGTRELVQGGWGFITVALIRALEVDPWFKTGTETSEDKETPP